MMKCKIEVLIPLIRPVPSLEDQAAMLERFHQCKGENSTTATTTTTTTTTATNDDVSSGVTEAATEEIRNEQVVLLLSRLLLAHTHDKNHNNFASLYDCMDYLQQGLRAMSALVSDGYETFTTVASDASSLEYSVEFTQYTHQEDDTPHHNSNIVVIAQTVPTAEPVVWAIPFWKQRHRHKHKMVGPMAEQPIAIVQHLLRQRIEQYTNEKKQKQKHKHKHLSCSSTKTRRKRPSRAAAQRITDYQEESFYHYPDQHDKEEDEERSVSTSMVVDQVYQVDEYGVIVPVTLTPKQRQRQRPNHYFQYQHQYPSYRSLKRGSHGYVKAAKLRDMVYNPLTSTEPRNLKEEYSIQATASVLDEALEAATGKRQRPPTSKCTQSPKQQQKQPQQQKQQSQTQQQKQRSLQLAQQQQWHQHYQQLVDFCTTHQQPPTTPRIVKSLLQLQHLRQWPIYHWLHQQRLLFHKKQLEAHKLTLLNQLLLDQYHWEWTQMSTDTTPTTTTTTTLTEANDNQRKSKSKARTTVVGTKRSRTASSTRPTKNNKSNKTKHKKRKMVPQNNTDNDDNDSDDDSVSAKVNAIVKKASAGTDPTVLGLVDHDDDDNDNDESASATHKNKRNRKRQRNNDPEDAAATLLELQQVKIQREKLRLQQERLRQLKQQQQQLQLAVFVAQKGESSSSTTAPTTTAPTTTTTTIGAAQKQPPAVAQDATRPTLASKQTTAAATAAVVVTKPSEIVNAYHAKEKLQHILNELRDGQQQQQQTTTTAGNGVVRRPRQNTKTKLTANEQLIQQQEAQFQEQESQIKLLWEKLGL